MNENKQNTIILGAGLTGLSAAYHGNGKVYESAEMCGGMCRSPKVKGYTFDFGIHVLHTKNDYVLKLLQTALKVKFYNKRRVGRIYSFDRFTKYPFQANTFGLPIPIAKECLVSYIKAYAKNYGTTNTKYDNYEDWITSTFGEGVAKHFMIPYSDKFWTVPAKDLTTDWLDVRVPIPTLEEVIQGALTEQTRELGPNVSFRYPIRNGISALPESFMKNGGVRVSFNKEAVKIDMKKNQIIFSDGTIKTYNVLISTIPLPELVSLANTPKTISTASDSLRFNSILCVNLGIDRDKLTDKHWIHYPEMKYSFCRMSFLKNFSPHLVPKGKSSISAEVAYSKDKMINKNTIVDTVIKDIIKAKIIKKSDKIELIDVRDIKYGYVIYDHNRNKNLNKIKNYFKKNSIIVCGRYGNWEYQWMDQAILDGKMGAEEAEKVLKKEVNSVY